MKKCYSTYRCIWLMLLAGIMITGYAFAQRTEIMYLSGTGLDDTKTWEFFCTNGRNAGKWTHIAVPSCWELQGFGKYDYGFAKDSMRGKEEGLYKYHFRVPDAWKDKTIQIVFKGVMTDAEVRINGQQAGPVHQGAFYAFRYDITRLLHHNQQNLLEVRVAKHSANASVNEAERKADFWIFGGIFRPVYLEALPRQHISHIAIDAKANGALRANVSASAGAKGLLSAQVFTLDNKPVGAPWTFPLAKGDMPAQLNGSVAGIRPWTPETPQLYKLKISLRSNGVTLHVAEQRFGFRTVEVRERDGIYVNGVKVKMKGVNRHAFWPTGGRTTHRGISIADVLLMKDMNMNAVRMSHYPPDDHFLDACDSLGLFVMDELAGWHGHYNTETGTARVREMVAHDVNHPSIIFWANGNEGGHNADLDPIIRSEDIQQRPVVHPWQLFGGFDTQHYREYNYGIGNYENGREIVMPTEFLHGQFDGGHGAGLDDYWEKMWHAPLSAGGFLWDFADQAVVRTDLYDSLDTDKHRGADGIVGPYREKEGSYFTIKEVWSPVHLERREITPAFDGKLNIENRYHYTNTRQCGFSWKLMKLPSRDSLQGSISSPALKPLEKGNLQINLPANWTQYDVLYVTAKDPYQRELFTWSFPIVRPAAWAQRQLNKKAGSAPIMHLTDSLYEISANDIRLQIQRRTGLLESVQNAAGTIPFGRGPVVQEGANNFSGFTHRYDADTLVIASSFDRQKSYNTLQWKIFPSGLVQMTVHYFPGAYFTQFAGVNFSFPEQQIRSVDFLGFGPYRVWKNRLKGNRFGLWHKEWNNTETGESWNYPEFRGYHANMYWSRFTTAGKQSFEVYTENEDLFLRLFTPAWKTDAWHNYEPLFPTGDISFMQGISSIGSKTQRNETTGPMGMKNIYYDYEKDPQRHLSIILYFQFMPPGQP